jgi:hypothetical protein
MSVKENTGLVRVITGRGVSRALTEIGILAPADGRL